jgi:hypothetical protein
MTLDNDLCAGWRAKTSLDEALARFVVDTKSRASGVWYLEDRHLVLAGFGWASDMPREVSDGFQAATRRVALDQIGLGIVKAAVSMQPAIGRRDPQATGLGGSATWIVRFGANTSLAVPIVDPTSNNVTGVLAVSTAAFVEAGDALWQRLIPLSNALGRSATESKSHEPDRRL